MHVILIRIMAILFTISSSLWKRGSIPNPWGYLFARVDSGGREKYVLNCLITQTNKDLRILFERHNRLWMTYFEWFSIQFVFFFNLYTSAVLSRIWRIYSECFFFCIFSSSSLSFCKSRGYILSALPPPCPLLLYFHHLSTGSSAACILYILS